MPQQSDGVINIDGFNWSALKLSEAKRNPLSPSEREARLRAEQATFEKYHTKLRTWIESHSGRVWTTIGDCTIASGFPNIGEAVAHLRRPEDVWSSSAPAFLSRAAAGRACRRHERPQPPASESRSARRGGKTTFEIPRRAGPFVVLRRHP